MPVRKKSSMKLDLNFKENAINNGPLTVRYYILSRYRGDLKPK